MKELISEIGKLPVFIQVIIGGIILFLLLRIFKNALKLLFWLIVATITISFIVYYFEIDLSSFVKNGVQ